MTDIVPAEGATEAELLETAVTIERRSDHPLDRAGVAHGDAQDVERLEAPDLESITGWRGRRG